MREILQHAERHARLFDQPYIGTEHVLLAMVEHDDWTRQVLAAQRVSESQVQTQVTGLVGAATHPARLSPEALPHSPRLARTLERAMDLMHAFKQKVLDSPHLLLAMLADEHSAAGRALVNLGLPLADLHAELYSQLAPLSAE